MKYKFNYNTVIKQNAELIYDLQGGTLPEPVILDQLERDWIGMLITWKNVTVNFKHLNKKIVFTCDIECEAFNGDVSVKLKKFEMVDINTGEEIQSDRDPAELVKDYLAKNLTITLKNRFSMDGINTNIKLTNRIKAI